MLLQFPKLKFYWRSCPSPAATTVATPLNFLATPKTPSLKFIGESAHCLLTTTVAKPSTSWHPLKHQDCQQLFVHDQQCAVKWGSLLKVDISSQLTDMFLMITSLAHKAGMRPLPMHFHIQRHPSYSFLLFSTSQEPSTPRLGSFFAQLKR